MENIRANLISRSANNMQISHISNNHGSLAQFKSIPEDTEIIVHSGGMFPVLANEQKEAQEAFQKEWLYKNIDELYSLIGYRDFLFCASALDYYETCAKLQSYGLSAIDITNRIVKMGDFNFFGIKESSSLLSDLDSLVCDKIDVCISNCSPENYYLLRAWLNAREQVPELIW